MSYELAAATVRHPCAPWPASRAARNASIRTSTFVASTACAQDFVVVGITDVVADTVVEDVGTGGEVAGDAADDCGARRGCAERHAPRLTSSAKTTAPRHDHRMENLF